LKIPIKKKILHWRKSAMEAPIAAPRLTDGLVLDALSFWVSSSK
jgi:hypothetical protein